MVVGWEGGFSRTAFLTKKFIFIGNFDTFDKIRIPIRIPLIFTPPLFTLYFSSAFILLPLNMCKMLDEWQTV